MFYSVEVILVLRSCCSWGQLFATLSSVGSQRQLSYTSSHLEILYDRNFLISTLSSCSFQETRSISAQGRLLFICLQFFFFGSSTPMWETKLIQTFLDCILDHLFFSLLNSVIIQFSCLTLKSSINIKPSVLIN